MQEEELIEKYIGLGSDAEGPVLRLEDGSEFPLWEWVDECLNRSREEAIAWLMTNPSAVLTREQAEAAYIYINKQQRSMHAIRNAMIKEQS